MAGTTCLQCQSPLPRRQLGKAGQPPKFCGDECRSAYKKAYAKRYFKANPHKWKASAERRSANPEKHRAYQAKWRAANREKIRAAARRASAKNKAERNAASERERKRLLQLRLRAADPDKARATARRSYAKHADKWRERSRQFAKTPKGRIVGAAYALARRARLAGVPSEPINREAVFARDKFICARCKQFVEPSQRSIDHRIPVSKGGSNTYDNVQLMHRVCNSRKRARMPEVDEALIQAVA